MTKYWSAGVLIDIPRFRCFVENSFLGKREGITEAYCFAVTLIESRPLLWTVHTIDGAVFSRLPIQALRGREEVVDPLDDRQLDPWGALSSNGHVVKHAYLKDYFVYCASEKTDEYGRYAFTIDYFDGGFAEDPLQHKTSNIIFLDNGQLAAWPNNWCRFVDDHFVDRAADVSGYKRQERYWHL